MKPYGVELTSAALRAARKLPPLVESRIRAALERLASDAAAKPGRISGKRVKTLTGVVDAMQRLRVGDYRVMFDVIEEDRVILILGIVHRKDLDRWLRNR